MPLHPIISSLGRHRLTVLLLTLQVAFTCAIVCNVVFMVANRIQRISITTGVIENELSMIHSTGIAKGANRQAQHAIDLAALRAIPGVTSAAAVSYSLPLSQSESSGGACPNSATKDRMMQLNAVAGSGCMQTGLFDGTPGLMSTLGLRLVAGRDFKPDEFVVGRTGKPAVAIVTRALADHLYPDQQALGKDIYTGDSVIRIVGVADNLLRPNLRKPGVDYDIMLLPQMPDNAGVTYVLRSAQQDQQRILKTAQATLIKVDPNRIVEPKEMRTFAQMRADFFQRDTTMIGLLLASAIGLLFVTALGITGLANFWVQQRTRQIGIRRAIGATRTDILRYFQSENFLIVSAGIVLGLLLAIALNLILMKNYELPRLPLFYLPISAIVLWLLGQLAVLGPAMRAASVPPVVATRSL